jgi:hypothetical protein
MHHGREQRHRVAQEGFVGADTALGRWIHGPSAVVAVNVQRDQPSVATTITNTWSCLPSRSDKTLEETPLTVEAVP